MPKTVTIPNIGDVDFPDTMSDEQIASASRKLHMQSFNSKDPIPQNPLSSLRPPELAQKINLPSKRTVASEMLPAIGGMVGGIPGAAVGAFAKQAITPDEPSFTGAAEDTFLQGVLPEAIGKGISAIATKTGIAKMLASKFVAGKSPAVRGAAETNLADDALKYITPETTNLEHAASNAKDTHISLRDAIEEAKGKYPDINIYKDVSTNTGLLDQQGKPIINTAKKIVGTKTSPQVEAAIADYGGKFGGNEVGRDLLSLQKDLENGVEVANRQSYKAISGRALSDVSQVRNFKLATGETGTINDLALTKITEAGYHHGNHTFDPAKAIDEITGPKKEIYREAMNDVTFKNYSDFLNVAKSMKDRVNPSESGVIQYAKNRLFLALPAALMGGTIGVVGKAATGLILGEAGIRQLMKNPEIASLTIQAMKGQIPPQAQSFVSKTLTNALRGTIVYMKTDSGEVPVKLNDAGNPVPVRESR